MCDCKIVNAEIASDGVRLTCECGNPQVDDETMETLELVGEYLKR